ncbi:uncharacterized protein [Halyomorpha halys]|uniref:uncharacterized protein n=1 Tax=Halyomorpha halys TaxID=286706 RepID=UPI0006D4DAAC|nr:uncharacterized protein LOC106690144 [Halyomorpha halys]
MVLKSMNTNWYGVDKHQSPLDEIKNKDTMKDIVEALKAGDERWKLSVDLKTEGMSMKKFEENILDVYGPAFDKLGVKGLAQVEAVVNKHTKSLNDIIKFSLIEMMKNKYDLDLSSITGLFNIENKKCQKMLKRSDATLKEEWERLVEFLHKKKLFSEAIKDEESIVDDDLKNLEIEEEEYRKTITVLMDKLMKKHEICKIALKIITGNLTNTNTKMIERMADEARRLKDNLATILSIAEKGLEKVRNKRKKRVKRRANNFIDEQCDICQQKEKVWEDERLKSTRYHEAMTVKDAKTFHSRFVKSGGMRGLVDQFKSLLDDNPSANMALPRLVVGMVHPEKMENIFLQLADYNRMVLIQKELDKRDRTLDRRIKLTIDQDNIYTSRYCMHCRRK